MARRTGTANLPLHGGKAPAWLFQRMATLGPAMIEVMVLERGPEEMLRRLADPWWFQAFGCVLGFDWHSSGVTTVTCGAMKEAYKHFGNDLGVHVRRQGRHEPQDAARDRSCRRAVFYHDGRQIGLRFEDERQGGLGGGAGRVRPVPPQLLLHRQRRLVRRAARNERRDALRAALP